MTLANRDLKFHSHSSDLLDIELLNSRDGTWMTHSLCHEQHKHAHILTALCGQRFANALEIGCTDSTLSRLLAQKCLRLLCCDASPRAVQQAQRELAGLGHVHVERRRLPMQWPEGSFDLIVLNEACSDLDASDTRRLVMRARMALAAHGTLIACHRRTIGDSSASTRFSSPEAAVARALHPDPLPAGVAPKHGNDLWIHASHSTIASPAASTAAS